MATMAGSNDLKLRERFINLAGSLYLLASKKRTTVADKPQITVLNYHKVSGSSFRKHLDYVRLHYQILSPDTFLDWLDDKAVIDSPSVILTFDDGYLSFYEEIYPILIETKTPVFMFVPTGFIGRSDYLWPDKLQVALEKSNARAITINDKTFCLYSRFYRSDFYTNVLHYVSSLSPETRNATCKHIIAQLNIRIAENDMEEYRLLAWPQIQEMARSGLVLFGSHTVNHPNLTLLSDDMLRFELQESKRILESHLKKSVMALAYPHGGPGFFDTRVINESEKLGYSCAFTTVQGNIREKKKNKFSLKRVMLFDYQKEGAVALKLQRCGN